MADDPLPIVYTPRLRDKLIPLALGIVLVVGGIFMLFDGGLTGGAIPVPRSVVGWLVSGVGLVVTLVVLRQHARGSPRFELNGEGILYDRGVRGTLRIAWGEFDRVEIRRYKQDRLGPRLDYLMLITTDGREIALSAPIRPDQVEDVCLAITRVAERARSSAAPSLE